MQNKEKNALDMQYRDFIQKIILGIGRVKAVQLMNYENPAEGFTVVVNNEYSALKIYWQYRHSTTIKQKSPHSAYIEKTEMGWIVSIPMKG